jgi:hypothetical protein
MYADAYCVTTNGVLTMSRRAVMGAGVALQAKQRFPGVDIALWDCIKRNGHVTQIIDTWAPFSPASCKPGTVLVSFPTKHHWRDPSPIDLIATSAVQLMALVEDQKWDRVLLPKPGCRKGGLLWKDVEPVLTDILDERVDVVDLQ